MTVVYTNSTFGSPPTLRTRCPGPYGPPTDLATAVVPLRAFGKRVLEIRLTGTQTFVDDGYTGSLAPDLIWREGCQVGVVDFSRLRL